MHDTPSVRTAVNGLSGGLYDDRFYYRKITETS